MKFTITRSTWWRGKGASASALLRADGMMCCLGHYALSRGVPKADINGVDTPKYIPGMPLMELLTPCGNYADRYACNTVCSNLMSTNDDYVILDPEREATLTGLFKQIDVDVEFVD